MTKSKVFLVLIICFLLAVASPFTALAKSDKTEGKSNSSSIKATEINIGNTEVDEELTVEEGNEEEDAVKPWVAMKNEFEAKKDEAEAQKDLLEQQIEALKAQYEMTPSEDLLAQIEQLSAEKAACFEEMRYCKEQMKLVMREQYTLEEWNNLQNLSLEFQSRGLNTLPVTNILVDKKNIKFDTPPVIKEGRILIPLRAISQATGATVTWDNDNKIITVVKDGQVIVLSIGENEILVNGEAFTVDEPAQSINNRTVVPIRFIVENLLLNVEWDDETDTLEIQ